LKTFLHRLSSPARNSSNATERSEIKIPPRVIPENSPLDQLHQPQKPY
jgi:hypothetical protein